MLLSNIDPRDRLGKRVRVRLRTDVACEALPHRRGALMHRFAREDGRTGTLRRCESRPAVPSHH